MSRSDVSTIKAYGGGAALLELTDRLDGAERDQIVAAAARLVKEVKKGPIQLLPCSHAYSQILNTVPEIALGPAQVCSSSVQPTLTTVRLCAAFQTSHFQLHGKNEPFGEDSCMGAWR